MGKNANLTVSGGKPITLSSLCPEGRMELYGHSIYFSDDLHTMKCERCQMGEELPDIVKETESNHLKRLNRPTAWFS